MSLLTLGVSGNTTAPFDADAFDYLLRATIVDATQTAATNTLVQGLKADGTWPLFYFFYPFMGPDPSAYMTNLISNTYFMTQGSGMRYTSNGFGGNGNFNHYGNTGFNPSVSMGQNSKTYSINIVEDQTENVYDFGCDNGAQQRGDMLLSAIPGNELYAGVSQAHNLHYTNNSPVNGEYTISRNLSTEFDIYIDGALFQNSVQTSTANPNFSMCICANNNGGAATTPSTRTYRSFWAASGMTATQISNTYNRLQTFFTAVGK